jgi:hypothetical protein
MTTGLQNQDIEKRSYMIWERQGRPHGHDLEHWLQAERELADETMMPARHQMLDTPKKTPTARKRKAPAGKPMLAN